MMKLFNSRKGSGLPMSFVVIAVLGILVLFMGLRGAILPSGNLLNKLSACETFGGVLVPGKCDLTLSKEMSFFNKNVDDVDMKCCKSISGKEEEFEKYKEEASSVQRSHFGVKATIGQSSWIPPNDGFVKDSNKIYIKYNDTLISTYHVIDNFNNGPFRLEFANAYEDGDYCKLMVSSNSQELTALTREWTDCSNKAYMLKDFKGLPSQIYEVKFTVKQKKDYSTEKETSIVSIKMSADASSSTTPTQIKYTFDSQPNSEEVYFSTTKILNKNYCVLKVLGETFSQGNYRIVYSESCVNYVPQQGNSLLLTQFNFNTPIDLLDLKTDHLCVYLKKNQTAFSKPYDVELKDCDSIIVIKNQPIKSCSEYSANACLDITKRTSESTKCYLDDGSCQACDEGIVDCSSYKTLFTCNSNDCIGTKCYWDYKNVNECLSCSKINSCSNYSDDRDECLANACGIKGGCKYVEPSWNDWNGDCVNK
ncbi:MAG: hypothetical protein PHU51_00235 [Candidatus Nanoarchaeia archaeon]|nr:hypothetical protein [Candidatus Nanoarchaeia archaeon]